MSLNVEGHMGLKSSPLATTSCKLTKQFLVLQHINAHHKNLSNVKSSIDTSCPKSWYKNANVKDQIKRENSARNYNRARPTSAKSQSSSNLEYLITENKVQGNFQSPNSDRNMKDKPSDLILEIEREDIIDKNSNKFTHQKSFTPRILKNDRSSKLTQLRCYNPPKRKAKEKTMEMDLMTQNESILISEKVSTQQTLPPEIELSDEEIRLKELDFLKNLTDDILVKHNFTDSEVEQTCEYHIKRNKYGLKTEQMRKLCIFVMENTKGIQHYSVGINKSYFDPYEYNEDYYYQPRLEHDVIKQVASFESSTAPSTIQLCNDDLESVQQSFVEDNINILSKSNSLDLQNEMELEKLCDTIDSIQIEESNRFSENNEINPLNFNEAFNSDDKKNVHFASQNETFSAQETDRSLTDISPFQVENSEDSNSLSLSPEMNRTFKHSMGTTYQNKVPNYDDDFDD